MFAYFIPIFINLHKIYFLYFLKVHKIDIAFFDFFSTIDISKDITDFNN